jgi:hypothetical protein
MLAICPNCGKVIEKPNKEIKNSYFCVSAYICDRCNNCFKVGFNSLRFPPQESENVAFVSNASKNNIRA